MKEISVRKVLGAGPGRIIFLINKEFIYAIGVAVTVGAPLSWLLTGNLFDIIAPGSIVSAVPLVLSLAGLLVMTALSVSWHVVKANTSKPSKYLRDE